MSYQEQFLRAAISLSREKMQAGCGGPFGAVIVRDGQILGRGWNQVTTANDPTAHAEVVAIREACRSLKTFHLEGCEIYSSCEPCPMCLAAIYWARLGHLYFGSSRTDAAGAGFDDEFLYKEINAPLAIRKVSTEQFLREEAWAVLQEWMQKPDKTPY
ncbi:MAG: zinc-binding CMP/dCMP deaminase [Verrucomicrobiales bacterium]|nr:zinc-binding CMP/dCMP deaminase [Verrucomicrobiales bacterium]